ncbi:unnamed protein product [Ceratitis capitata]|uniref:(Mediterranean fruit fly) hypothetical protein n=1 Tax=Ceratitis capitata TaxID=7213 RepID=A0A811U2W3_CERCA|nr:unnamed protein product [Ceratitis capitata]
MKYSAKETRKTLSAHFVHLDITKIGKTQDRQGMEKKLWKKWKLCDKSKEELSADCAPVTRGQQLYRKRCSTQEKTGSFAYREQCSEIKSPMRKGTLESTLTVMG